MRIVIAGQFPPPLTGQNLMIRELYEDLKASSSCKVDHLPLNFSAGTKDMRKFSLGKIWVLFQVYVALLKLRLKGEIDLIVYPAGGPHKMPIIRDMILLPWIYLWTKKVAIHFHAAGISDALPKYPSWASSLIRFVYRKADAAIVMTEFCSKDPKYLGISQIKVIPHQIEDVYEESFLDRDHDIPRVLYIGHLDKQKGVLDLLYALGILKKDGVAFECILAGEPFPTLKKEELLGEINRLGLKDLVKIVGRVEGDEKRKLFGSSDILVFPSRAEQESFGLVQIEGMMWGMPVVSTDWRGNKEVLGSDQWCVSIGKCFILDFASKLKELLISQELRNAIGCENRKGFLERFKKQDRQRVVRLLLE